MHRSSSRPITLATVLAIAATSPMLHAQSLGTQDPNAPRLSTPAQQRPATPTISNDASKRTSAPAIPRTGPATLKDNVVQKPASAAKPAAGKMVTDRSGQPISGAVEVGTNRVLDPRTGQIHSTMPTAGGAQVID